MELEAKECRVPNGTYLARIQSLETKTTEKGNALRILTQIESDDSNLNGALVSTLTGMVVAPGERLTRWIEAALVCKVVPGTRYQVEQLIGRPVLIQVENKANKQGEIHPQITSVWAAE